jgi:hypothetical protein
MCDQKVTPAVQHRQQSHGMASMILSTYHPGRPCGQLLHDAQVARARRRVRSTEGIYKEFVNEVVGLVRTANELVCSAMSILRGEWKHGPDRGHEVTHNAIKKRRIPVGRRFRFRAVWRGELSHHHSRIWEPRRVAYLQRSHSSKVHSAMTGDCPGASAGRWNLGTANATHVFGAQV